MKSKQKKGKKSKEHISSHDLRELMGEFDRVYKRTKGGALRQK